MWSGRKEQAVGKSNHGRRIVPLQAPVHKRVPGQHLRVPGGAAVTEPQLGSPANHRQLQVTAGEAGEASLTWWRDRRQGMWAAPWGAWPGSSLHALQGRDKLKTGFLHFPLSPIWLTAEWESGQESDFYDFLNLPCNKSRKLDDRADCRNDSVYVCVFVCIM